MSSFPFQQVAMIFHRVAFIRVAQSLIAAMAASAAAKSPIISAMGHNASCTTQHTVIPAPDDWATSKLDRASA